MRKLHKLIGVLCLGVALSASIDAWAQGGGRRGRDRQARAERRRALDRLRTGAFQEALDALQRSQQIVPSAGNLVLIGRCYEGLGRRAEAIESLNQALRGRLSRTERAAATRLLARLRAPARPPGPAATPAAPAGPTRQAVDVERAGPQESDDEESPEPATEPPPPQPAPSPGPPGSVIAPSVAPSATPAATVDLEPHVRPQPTRGSSAVGVALVFTAPLTQPQVLGTGIGYAAAFDLALEPDSRLRFGVDVTFSPPNGVLWRLEGALGAEYAIPILGDRSLEASARLGLGASLFNLSLPGLVLSPGTYGGAFVRLAAAATYRIGRRWTIRAVPLAIDLAPIASTPANLESRPVLRYRAEIGIGAIF